MIPLTYWALLLCFLQVAEPKIDFGSAASIDNTDNLVQYEYQYKVDEGQHRGPVMDRWERRLGEYVKGAYSVLQPDGSVRTVDYEVDGDSGYHAVTRLTPPTSEYLSYQQLSQSHELFPDSALSLPAGDPSFPEVPPRKSFDKIVNYHARPPYINKREFKDHKAAASTNLATAVFQVQKPLSPANYNVPQPQNLIYYKTPAGKIQPNSNLPQKIFNVDAFLPTKATNVEYIYTNGITDIVAKENTRPILFRPNTITDSPKKAVKRHSKLVRRFNSMREVF